MNLPLDIAKLATLNAVQRRVVYDTLDIDVLERHEAEEAVRLVIAGKATSAGRHEMVKTQ
ncbi:MAG: hypothetical protein AABM43_09825 [Actinomycetota bacterium]